MEDYTTLSSPTIAEGATGGVHKRRATRHRIETLAYADLGPGNGGFPINISEMGMAFQGIQPLEREQVLCMKLRLPGMKEAVQATGQVIWLNELGKGGGLEFIDLTAESRHLINGWLTSQSQTDSPIERVPSTPQDVEKRELRLPIHPRSTAHEGSKAINSDLNLTSILSHSKSSAATKPAAVTTGAIIGNKSIVGLRAERKAEPVPQKSGNKRTWIVAYATGIVTSVAIMIALMVAFGVISIQFRWPHQTADANVTHPVTEAGPAKVVDSPRTISRDESTIDQVASGLVASLHQSTARSNGSLAERPAAKPAAPEPSRAKTTSTANPEAPKPSFQPATAPLAAIPSPVTPGRNLDFVPPVVVLVPAESTIGTQLSITTPAPPTPAPTVSSPAPLKASNLEAPVVIKRTNPIYPELAKAKGVSGSVELQFTISPEGNVRDVRVVKGNPLLVHSAIDAVQAWHYQPARLNGNPVKADSSIVFNFGIK